MNDAELDALLDRSGLRAIAIPEYTKEELDAANERLQKHIAATRCARCHRQGTPKSETPHEDGLWPVCADADDCRKHE